MVYKLYLKSKQHGFLYTKILRTNNLANAIKNAESIASEDDAEIILLDRILEEKYPKSNSTKNVILNPNLSLVSKCHQMREGRSGYHARR